MSQCNSCQTGCGGCHASCGGCSPTLTASQQALLQTLASVLYLPLGQFLLVPKGGYPEDGTLALSPVLLETEDDTLEQVMDRADALVALARAGLITLDFDLPLSNYSYEVYFRSALFRTFSLQFAHAPKGRPVLRRGSIAITSTGLAMAAQV